MNKEKWWLIVCMVALMGCIGLGYFHTNKHVTILFHYDVKSSSCYKLRFSLFEDADLQEITSCTGTLDEAVFGLPAVGGFSSTHYFNFDSMYISIYDLEDVRVAEERVPVEFWLFKCVEVYYDPTDSPSIQVKKKYMCEEMIVE
ncbi:MAG: hypothetical protein AAFP89_08930 [Bacteroidota bacterium]